MRQYLQEKVETALRSLNLPDRPKPTFERPKQAEHGDLTTNVAMVLARSVKRNPTKLASDIVSRLELESDLVEKVEIAGPGFINFWFKDKFYLQQLREILEKGSRYGRSEAGGNKKTQVEFVSANPTGPLTVGHGRNAVLGDTIANLLEWTGHDVTREYYYNNAGRQMRVLGDSVRLRYLELLDEPVAFPEDYYQGEYIKDIARHLLASHGTVLRKEPPEGIFKERAEEEIFNDIKKILKRLGTKFDVFYNERSLYETGKVQEVVDELRRLGYAYDHEGAVWFRATSFQGEKDKVIVKSSGEPTYRLPDIAYHREKFRRGFELIVDILGADHIATYPDVIAGLKALGFDTEKVKVLIHQFVTLVRNGEVVKMSTRKANFVTLAELIDEVGPDVVRYFFLMRSHMSHLNFDLGLAKEQSEQNPVYYLQYAHARIASILKYAEIEGVSTRAVSGPRLELLTEAEAIAMVKKLAEFPDTVESCSFSFEPHRLTEYLHDVAGLFHKFYHVHRVVTDNKPLTCARLALCQATKTVLANGFAILGISAPETM
ncbi:MAG: arginine--tRNA ligase [Bacteroidota bacterium]